MVVTIEEDELATEANILGPQFGLELILVDVPSKATEGTNIDVVLSGVLCASCCTTVVLPEVVAAIGDAMPWFTEVADTTVWGVDLAASGDTVILPAIPKAERGH